MELTLEHLVGRSLPEVERVLVARDFPDRLVAASGTLRCAALLSLDEQEGCLVRCTDFVVGGAFNVGILGRFGTVGWRETVTWDPARHEGRFTVVPHLPAAIVKRVSCDGTYVLASMLGGRTRRTVNVRLVIDVPLLRGTIERRVAALLGEVFDDEARLLGGEGGR